ncbi:hypothetical protein WICMUC_004707 [Wickerhamomyces mucosus]|uniref:Exonuclease domain-containing protein n=1 Tax=Wickerhamomyces mucosus TaxID=1378264 RepID=A0A9P8PH26_9ASCO|nr:hypothetical protein WICMUC_004707 [Wickerhamomyces mucosus]
MSTEFLPLPKYDPSLKIDTKSSTYQPIVWIDCEMTGLDVFNDHIIEIACIITDGDLNIVDPGYESVVHCDKSIMDQMNEWCISHHGASGLTDKVINSTKVHSEVETELLSYIQKFTNKGTAVLAGNTVHMDRIFLYREFPKIVDWLHYRIIDVSSFRELGHRHNKNMMQNCPRKREAHTAMSDILESIAQMKWLRDNYLIGPNETK